MIEFQYFEGCPNSEKTLANLRSLIGRGFFAEDELSIVEVPTPELAEELRFQGSPSILVDGVDLVTGRASETANWSCRVYTIDGTRTGALDADYMIGRIRQLRR